MYINCLYFLGYTSILCILIELFVCGLFRSKFYQLMMYSVILRRTCWFWFWDRRALWFWFLSASRVQLADLPFLNPEGNENLNIASCRKRKRTQQQPSKNPRPKRKECVNDPIVAKFHELVSQGPEYICISCNQVFFKHSVVEFNHVNYSSNSLINNCITSVESFDNKLEILWAMLTKWYHPLPHVL